MSPGACAPASAINPRAIVEHALRSPGETAQPINWSIQEIRRIAIKLTHRRLQPAHILAWSLWRHAHQAQARRAHLRRSNLKTKMQL
jgi:hypothetical protein